MSPFLRDAALDSPSIAVHFNFPDESLVKYIHVEGLKPFQYFDGLKSFRHQTEAEETELQVRVPPNVRKEDLSAFILFLYEGNLPSADWRQVGAEG